MTHVRPPSDPLTPEELEEMKGRTRQLTEAAWRYIKPPDSAEEYVKIGGATDAFFIAHARTDLPRCIAEIERLGVALVQEVADNTRIRQEVAKLMVALDKGEIKMNMDLMNEFYCILGLEPPYPTH